MGSRGSSRRSAPHAARDTTRRCRSARLSCTRPTPSGSLAWKLNAAMTVMHVCVFQRTRGRVGGTLDGAPLLILHHTGAKSGVRRHLCHPQMADQELGLVADCVLERLTEVDVEVADRIALDLAAWGGHGVAHRGLGGRHRVLVADAKQARALSLPR